MPNRLSVLIPYFDERELLTETLSSLLSQAEAPDEVLIYDDGSREPPGPWIPKGYDVPVIHGGVNRGPGFARNQLLDASRCDYVHFQDADDLFDPAWCARVRAAIAGSTPDVVLTEVCSFTEGGIVSPAVVRLNELVQMRDLVRFTLTGALLPATSTFRRELGLQIGGFETRETLPLSEDFHFHVRLAAAASTYELIRDPLIRLRLRPNSLSRDASGERTANYVAAVMAVRQLAGSLPARYRPDLSDAAARFGSTLLLYGEEQDAREAFALCRDLGGATFKQRRFLYRFTARLLGPGTAERLGRLFRTIVPQAIRAYLARQGI